MQVKGILMNKTRENGKKPNFGPDFGRFWPKFDPQKTFLLVFPLLDLAHSCKLPLYAIPRKTKEPKLGKQQKS